MILEVRGKATLHSHQGEAKRAVSQALVNLDDRLRLGADGEVQLVFLSDLHKERLKPGREVTIDYKGCQPADAVLERDTSVLMTFVRLPKGTFYMGWGQLFWDGKKKGVKTEIKEDFEIAVHDVTQGQWQAVLGDNPSWFSRKGNGRTDVLDISDEELKLFPVESVSWNDAQEFLKKLNEKERGRGYVYRLPTEVEWEYACRGGATSEEECSYYFYFDKPTNDLSSEQANFYDHIQFGKAPKGKFLGRTTRVGAYPSNKLGVCDMHGNVWQWTATSEGSNRVWRGGSWNDAGPSCQAAWRNGYPPTHRSHSVGFRLARVPVRPRSRQRIGRAPSLRGGASLPWFSQLPGREAIMAGDVFHPRAPEAAHVRRRQPDLRPARLADGVPHARAAARRHAVLDAREADAAGRHPVPARRPGTAWNGSLGRAASAKMP
jgi:formylglycine-generating enzyme required for sulfatase activity